MKKILLAVDGSESCNKATNTTVELAEQLNADVTILTVIEEHMSYDSYTQDDFKNVKDKKKYHEEHGEIIVTECANTFNNPKIKIEKLTKKGSPAEVICQVAEENNFDLIVVADMGRNAVKKFLLGSTTEKVVRHATTSVLVVK